MGKLLLTHKFVFVARQVQCRINYTLSIVLFLLHFNASSQCNTTSGIIEGYSFNDKDVNGIKSIADLPLANIIVMELKLLRQSLMLMDIIDLLA